MIRAKTTRGAQDSAQPYAFADGTAKGGLPQAIAMGIVSVALYLRSMVSSRAEPVAPESPEPEEAGRSAPVRETLAAPEPEEAAPEDPAPQTPASPEATAFITSFPVSTGANVVSLFAPGTGAQAGRGPAPAPFAQAPAPNLWDGLGEMPARSAPIDVSRLIASAEGAAPAAAQMPSDTGTPDGGGSPPASGAGAPPPPAVPGPGHPVHAPQAANRAPVRLRSVTLDDMLSLGAIMIATQSLLAGTHDPDGDALQVTGVTASAGTIVPVEGGFLYTPDPAATGTVQLAYQVSDGTASIVQTAQFDLRPAPTEGGDGDDMLTGTEGADLLDGGAGDDAIIGGDGGDVIAGGSGDDRLTGGAGDDVITGGAGDDVIFGGAGDDRLDGGMGDDSVHGDAGDDVIAGGAGHDDLFGGDGDDALSGGTGNDRIAGGEGQDVASGGEGDDVLSGGAGRDVLTGDAGDDRLDGDAGADSLDGGAGDDVLTDGAGADVVVGGTGSDRVIATPDAADDVFHGDADQGDATTGDMDTLDYSAVRVGLHIDLATGSARGAESGHDSFDGFEVVIAGSGDDQVTGSAGADAVADGAGHDTVDLGAGNDRMVVSVDRTSDAFDGGSGQDTLDLSDHTIGVTIDIEAGTLDGTGTGHDTFESFEIVIAGSGDDRVTGSAGADVVTDGAGRDTVDLGAGNDRMVVTIDMDADAFDGGAGQDTLDLSDHTINLTIDMEAGTLDGTGTGHDTFESFEIVIAGSGNDSVTGSAGNDIVTDGAGVDAVALGAGNDVMVMTVDMAADTFDGGAGQDRLDLSDHEIGVTVDLARGTVTCTEIDAATDSFTGFEAVVGSCADDVFVAGAEDMLLTGGEGADVYRFNQTEGLSQTAATITDFAVGDRIETLRYKIFEDNSGSGSDTGTLGLRLDGSGIPDTLKSTILSFSFNVDADDLVVTRLQIHEDNDVTAWISLQGQHVLFVFDTF